MTSSACTKAVPGRRVGGRGAPGPAAARRADSARARRGTVTHMPPELLASGVLGRACDVWSFGILLWCAARALPLPARPCCRPRLAAGPRARAAAAAAYPPAQAATPLRSRLHHRRPLLGRAAAGSHRRPLQAAPLLPTVPARMGVSAASRARAAAGRWWRAAARGRR
jgi:hypothetical protein